MRPLPAFVDPNAKKLLEKLCAERGIRSDLVRQLTEILAAHSGKGRRHGLNDEFDLVLSEYTPRLQTLS